MSEERFIPAGGTSRWLIGIGDVVEDFWISSEYVSLDEGFPSSDERWRNPFRVVLA